MKTIRDLYEDKELENLEEGVLAGATKIATILGFSAMGAMATFGGAVLVASAKRFKLGSKISKLFRKIAGKDAKLNYNKGVDHLKSKTTDYKNYKNSETGDKLTEVLKAISKRDYQEALAEYKVSGVYEKNDAIRIIALAVTEEFGEPPLYYISPGNESFQFLKRIVGPRTAKAVSDSVLYALNKNKSYFSDVEAFVSDKEKVEDELGDGY
jgi:hypothetical protein